MNDGASISLIERLNDEMAMVNDKSQRCLVKIENGHHGAGSGTIIHPEGLIITNAHVVGRKKLKVTLWDGRTLNGQVAAVDQKKDLAAVTVESKELNAVELVKDGQVQPGQWVLALGHPWGIQGAATAGMIIAVGRTVESLPYKGQLVQVGLRLRPGHSGGPMLNDGGKLVGINTMISGPEVGLAVPSRTIKQFLKESLISSDSKPSRILSVVLLSPLTLYHIPRL